MVTAPDKAYLSGASDFSGKMLQKAMALLYRQSKERMTSTMKPYALL